MYLSVSTKYDSFFFYQAKFWSQKKINEKRKKDNQVKNEQLTGVINKFLKVDYLTNNDCHEWQPHQLQAKNH